MRINPIFASVKSSVSFKKNDLAQTVPDELKFSSKPNISFSGVQEFKNMQKCMIFDVEDCILRNKTYSEREIEEIIQQFSPKTTFKQTTPMYNQFNAPITAQTKQSYWLLPSGKKEDTLGIITFPQEVSANFPKWNFKKDKLLLAARLIHEFTHVLSEENLASQSVTKLIEKHIKDRVGAKGIQYTLEVSSGIYGYLEAVMTDIYQTALKTKSNFPSKVKKDDTIDMKFVLEKGSDVDAVLEDFMEDMKSRYGYSVDWDFVNHYIATRSRAEASAYQAETEFLKKHTNLSDVKTDFDLKVDMFKKMATYFNKN